MVLSFERYDDALTDARVADNRSSFDTLNGWLHGPEHEGTLDADAFQRLANRVTFERFEVDDDVRQLGQDGALRYG